MIPDLNVPLQDEFLLAKTPLDFEGLAADEAYEMRHTHRVVKQSDIILLMCLLQDEFTVEQMEAAYDFYEPMTLHYSSLSHNTHSIIAAKIGRDDEAYQYFMNAAGLDLDNFRNATEDGLHAAALGGTWQTIAYGFLGMRLTPQGIAFDPRLPKAWHSLTMKIVYRDYVLDLCVTHDDCRIVVDGSDANGSACLLIGDESYELIDGQTITTEAGALA
jgi:trehalose/maltose hydrolase-like predicted phosphorylase